MTATTEPSPWRIAIPSSVTLAGIFFGLLCIALAGSWPYGACLALIGASLCDMMVSRLPLPSYKRFPNRLLQITFYGLIAMGLTMLTLQQPGGTVLLGFLILYLLSGVRHVATRLRG